MNKLGNVVVATTASFGDFRQEIDGMFSRFRDGIRISIAFIMVFAAGASWCAFSSPETFRQLADFPAIQYFLMWAIPVAVIMVSWGIVPRRR